MGDQERDTMSQDSQNTSTKLTERVKNKMSSCLRISEGLEIRLLNMKQDHKDEDNMVQRMSLGLTTEKPTKIILLVGATGAGKTTLINNMVNYIYGVKFTDDFRFILIDDDKAPKKNQAESQTDLITAYSFNHMEGMPFDYNYLLVDTPGFGDTRGIQRDRKTMEQMEMFFKQTWGVDSVDGVGFVTQSSAARLTQTQRYVYDGISSMFGKDIKQNIFVMATFADSKTPEVLAALEQAEVNYASYYKFNNSALYAKTKPINEDDEFSEMDGYICKLFWEMGHKNMGEFFKKLGGTFPASLTLTKEVLTKRNQLQTVVVELHKQIHLGLDKLSNLRQERDMLDKYSEEIKGCENYEEVIEVPNIVKEDLDTGEYVTNCVTCNVSCHYPCYIPDDGEKWKCSVMLGKDMDRSCTICPNKCSWDIHANMPFRFDHTIVKETRTVQQLLDRYNKAKQGKITKEQAVKQIEIVINDSSNDLKQMVGKVQKCVAVLEKIALKPNPLSTTEYIDLMIESEKMQKKQHFEKRIKLLGQIKTEIAVIAGVTNEKNINDLEGATLLENFEKMMGNV